MTGLHFYLWSHGGRKEWSRRVSNQKDFVKEKTWITWENIEGLGTIEVDKKAEIASEQKIEGTCSEVLDKWCLGS